MVIRDHNEAFLEGKNLDLSCPSTVFEAESIDMREALSWVMIRRERRVIVETYSLFTVATIHGKNENMLEVGHIIDQCKMMSLTFENKPTS